MAEGASTVPDLETQKNKISDLLKLPLEKGHTWCLIDNLWYKQWKKYVGYDSWDTSLIGEQSSYPGPIDNSMLLKEDGELKEHLMDESHYVLLPQEGWDLLSQWYGVVEGQNSICRKVIEFGMFVKHCKVEIYLLEFKLCQDQNMDHPIIRKFSKSDTIGYIEQEMRSIFKIPENKETRLWSFYSTNTYELLQSRENTVQDSGLNPGQILIIEQKNEDNTWSMRVKSAGATLIVSSTTDSGTTDGRTMYNNPPNTIVQTEQGSTSNRNATRSYGSVGGYCSSSYNYDFQSSVSGTVLPGLSGLSNLGNTCFMNSAIQCMSNTPLLTDYFLNDHYWNELNVDNPLGMNGEIAKSYGDLIKNMWSGRSSNTVPRNFKMIVGRFAPQFSGYQQQDCQELMAFLLDGLHEDLNRVKKKPYIELKDSDGRPDEAVSSEAWDNYLKRNNSVIVDIFHGLLKSTLVCPECSKISVTFDPFCYLSLPLPVKKERMIEFRLVLADCERRPLHMKVTVSKLGTVLDLCEAVSRVSSIPAANLVVVDVYNYRLHKTFENNENLSNISDRDEIFVYEIPPAESNSSNALFLPVYLKERRYKSAINCCIATSQVFAHPFYILVQSKNCTYDTLYETISKRLSRYVHLPSTEEDWDFIEGLESERMNGEVEMSNGDDYDSDQGDGEKENMEETDASDKSDKVCRMFTIQSVNSSGTVEIEKLHTDGRVLKLSNRTYLSVEFDSKIKERFFDDKEAAAFDDHESINSRLSQKKQVIQLSECLELFTTTEKLGAEDPWYCPSCKKHQQATKKFDLWQLPRVLIIHLKRFSYSRCWRDKLDTLVNFPIEGLKMDSYIINSNHVPAVYDLIAVANHYGGMGGGHYTAYGKNKNTNDWHYFDDSTVSSSTEENVVSKAAYVLFYMRRDSKPAIHQNANRTISAALGAPQSNSGSSPEDNGASSSDEDCSMDVN